jgi:NitT/TauT family transport system substrate-binding protein
MISLKQKQIDAALVPEPWATVATSGEDAPARVMIPWDEIPPGNAQVPTTIMVANHRLIHYHETILERLLNVHQETVEWMQQHPQESILLIQSQIKQLTGKKIELELLNKAYANMQLTTTIQPQYVQELSDMAVRAGYIRKKELTDGLIWNHK